MKILVLGGQGFVGQHVIAQLESSGEEHIVHQRSRRGGLDMLDLASVEKTLTELKPDVIINCAAHVGSLHYVTTFAADVLHDNVQMTLNLYHAVQRIVPKARIINPISNCSYPGDADVHAEPAFWDGPVHHSVWSYGNSRRFIVVISRCYAMQYGIDSVNFFVPNAYGPGDYTDPNKTHALNGMIIRMLDAKARGAKNFEIWGSGKPTREWIYVQDLATMLAQAVTFPGPQIDPINIAQNKAYAIAETASMIKDASGFAGELVFNTAYQDGAPTKRLDDTLFRARYPQFTFTPMRTGIEATITYYQEALSK